VWAQRSGHGRCRRGRRDEDRRGGDVSTTRGYGQIAGRSSRRRPRSARPRTSCSRRRAATSCQTGCARVVIGAGCARLSGRWRPSAPRRPRGSRVTAASGWLNAGADCVRTESSSATSSASTPPGTRPGAPATGHGGWSTRPTTSSPIRSPGAGGRDQHHRPDSRNLKTTRGWVQGYNAQTVGACGRRRLPGRRHRRGRDRAPVPALAARYARPAPP
jgi:hypothetical protein